MPSDCAIPRGLAEGPVPLSPPPDGATGSNAARARQISRARFLFVLALAPYVFWLVTAYRYHFLDGVNLAIHEAGHLLFGFDGETLQFLGGTLLQVLFPAAFVFEFARRRDGRPAPVLPVVLERQLSHSGGEQLDHRNQRGADRLLGDFPLRGQQRGWQPGVAGRRPP